MVIISMINKIETVNEFSLNLFHLKWIENLGLSPDLIWIYVECLLKFQSELYEIILEFNNNFVREAIEWQGT